MTIGSQISISGPYLGNGVTTQFDYQFKIFDKKHIQVKRHKSDGSADLLILDVDYSVTDVGNDGGGKVVMNVAPVTGEQVTITRLIPFVQELDLENQGRYYAEDIERAFDESVMRDQQLKEKLDRAIFVGENVDVAAKDKLVTDIGLAAFAREWAVEQEDVSVNDGVNPTGFSSYHWAQKAQAAATVAEAIANFDPTTKLDKAGGVVSGDLTVGGDVTVSGDLSADNVYSKTQADDKFLTKTQAADDYLGKTAVAAQAIKLATPRTITISGDTRSFDGTDDIVWTAEDLGFAYGVDPNGAWGWMKRPDGIIEQWGKVNVTSSSFHVVYFSIAFPTLCSQIIISGESAVNKTCYISPHNRTNTQFTINNTWGAGTSSFMGILSWRAIGW